MVREPGQRTRSERGSNTYIHSARQSAHAPAVPFYSPCNATVLYLCKVSKRAVTHGVLCDEPKILFSSTLPQTPLPAQMSWLAIHIPVASVAPQSSKLEKVAEEVQESLKQRLNRLRRHSEMFTWKCAFSRKYMKANRKEDVHFTTYV